MRPSRLSLLFDYFKFVRRLLPLVHLVVVAGFQVVVSLVVGFVVFGRGGEFRIIRRDLLLDFGQLRFDRLDRPAQFAELLLLLLALLVGQFPRRRGVPVRSGLRGGFRRGIRRGFAAGFAGASRRSISCRDSSLRFSRK